MLEIFVFSLIFKYSIVPRIESRLGVRLHKWGIGSEMTIFGKFKARSRMIAIQVLIQYFFVKFSKNPNLAIQQLNDRVSCELDLAKANYDIREATRFEIVLSFLVLINTLLWIILVLIICFFIR